MPRHFKVHELLNERELEDLRAYAREPGRTIDQLHEWLLAKGYTLSRGAVGNWKQKFDEELMAERFSRSGDFARSIVEAAKAAGGSVEISDAAVLQLSQVIFEQSVRLQADGEVDAQDIQRLTKSLVNLVGSKQRIEDLKRDYEQRQHAAVAEAERTVKAGGSGEDVVRKMREILGIKDAA